MTKKLKDIIKESDDLFLIKVNKPDKHNRSTWQFTMLDSRWEDKSFDGHKLQTVYLRRDNYFFMAFKSYLDDKIVYFVDPQKAMFRSSVRKFVNCQKDYSVYTNDISKTKNEPSFRITEREMKSNHIDNFLDLCYEYREYSAIGTGYTRNIRNLVVMDIDVDCTKPDNQNEINNLLIEFAKYNSLPDFYIFNHESNHIQLQWLIRNFNYKEVSLDIMENIETELNMDLIKNKELNYRGTDFTKITKSGIDYRRFTLALCDIVKKRKFGDKNYTFWKAKNPMSAMEGMYNLELKIPYLYEGEIRYLENDRIKELFSTKKARQTYFEEAPYITEIYDKLDTLMRPLIKKVTEKKVLKIVDAEDVSEKKIEYHQKVTDNQDSDSESYGTSRNTFVLKCTQKTTWDLAKKYGYKQPEHIKGLKQIDFSIFRSEVFKLVKEKFKEEDKKYKGIWPDTTNKSRYTNDEFQRTFDKSFIWSVQNFKSISYSNEDRKRSQESRHYRKDIKLMTVDKIRLRNESISRNDLLKEVNKSLSKKGIKTISLGSLKRYIAESNSLTDQDRDILYNEQKPILEDRRHQINS